MDISESEDKFLVAAEIPGLEAKDVNVTLSGDMLAIKGEKKKETEEKDQHCYCTERYYGAFQRIVQLPSNVPADKIEATFDKGVLKVTIPKAEEAKRKGEPMREIKRILVPVDFTKSSSKILPYALTFCEKFGATLYLLHVVEDYSKWTGGFYLPGIPLDLYRKEALSAAEKGIESAGQQLQGYPHFQKKIAFGDPIQEILKTIESEDIDLVIMGTHGRKGLEHVFFGSVAENVVKKSPAPVLTINPYKAK